MNAKLTVKFVLSSSLALVLTSAYAADKNDADLDAKTAAILKRDFQDKGIAKLDRLDQDKVQALCTHYLDNPPPAEKERLQAEQQASTKWPADGKYMGDWKAGEKLAQSGKGLTWSDKPDTAIGGGCYNCHQLSPKEIAYGTIGPSLLHYGKTRGDSEAIQRATYGRIYNAKAYNLCANMPRFGHMGILTEAQIKDLVALLLDPASPVNQ